MSVKCSAPFYEAPIHHESCQTTVLFIGQEIDGQRQPTPHQHGAQTLVSKRTDEAGERHGRDMVEDGHSSKLRPPWVANRASRATSGRMER